MTLQASNFRAFRASFSGYASLCVGSRILPALAIYACLWASVYAQPPTTPAVPTEPIATDSASQVEVQPEAKPDQQPEVNADSVADGKPAVPETPVEARQFLEVSNAMLKTIESTTIAAEAAGIIQSLDVREGHQVTVGQELGRIRDAGVKLQVERAKATMEVAQRKKNDDIDERLAKKSQAVAMNEYQRAVAANKRVRDTYPLNEVDRLKLVADRSQLEVERAAWLRGMAALEAAVSETEYRQALELQERHRLVAPVKGVVVSLEKHLGEWVEPGAPLLKIEQIDRLRVEGFISAADSMQELVGKTASVLFSSTRGTAQTQGKVVFVSPSVDPILTTVRVFIEIDNAEGKFRPGLSVRASIHLAP